VPNPNGLAGEGNAASDLLCLQPQVARAECNLLLNQPVEQLGGGVLEDQTGLGGDLGNGVIVWTQAVDGDLPGHLRPRVRLLLLKQAKKSQRQGALPAPGVASNQHEGLSGNGEVNAVERANTWIADA
jgi:hypothetical protein